MDQNINTRLTPNRQPGVTTVTRNNQQLANNLINNLFNNPAVFQNPQLFSFVLQLVQQLLGQVRPQTPNPQPPNPNPQPPNPNPPGPSREFSRVDGVGNNVQRPQLGSANTPFVKGVQTDPRREPGGIVEQTLPSAREVSNVVSAQTGNTQNRKGLSDMFWLWGQFLDHDITLTPANNGEKADIRVPTGDRLFDPNGTGAATIGFTRSDAVRGPDGQRQHTNALTAFIDGSNVYGADSQTANDLRAFQGGRLRTGQNGLLPMNNQQQFVAGDERANENAGLTSMHTLWMREHNRVADALAARNPGMSDENLYQEARRVVVAQMQAITYNEFLPNLLGEGGLSRYNGYNPNVNPSISNEFSSAAYRFGHSMLSPNLLRLDENGRESPEGSLSLREAFFRPDQVSRSGIDPFLRGLASQTAQAVDPMVIDDVRNFLFGPPGAGGLDLAALNIQRGRDHGIPGYNDLREQLGLRRITSFNDPIFKGDFGQKLAQVYNSPDDVDAWVAGLAENQVGNSMVGETLQVIMSDQFERIRAGDRFWYENQFSTQDVNTLNNLRLSDIIRRNTGIQNIQGNVMQASNVHLNNLSPAAADTAQRSGNPTASLLRQAPVGTAERVLSPPPADPAQLQRINDAFVGGDLG